MISDKDYEKIKKELEDTIDDILDDNLQLAHVKEIKTAVEWYKKSREGEIEPAKIIGIINNLILGRLSETMPSELANSLEEKLNDLVIQNSSTGISIKKPLLSSEIEVDIDLVANGTVPLGKITIGLALDVSFALENMRTSESKGKKQFEIERIVFSSVLTLFSKMILGTKSIQLGQKDFELKDVVFSLA
jgi:hypothetical protein